MMKMLNCLSPRRGNSALLCLMLALPLLLGGCVLGPKYATPKVTSSEQWRAMDQPGFTGQPLDRVAWWSALNDPVLDGLIKQAFEQNLTLQAASLRVVQARLGRSAIAMSYLPVMVGQGSVSHSNLSTNVTPEVRIDKPGREARTPRDRRGPFADPIRENIRQEVRTQLSQQVAGSLPSVSVTPELDVYDVGIDAIWELDLWGRKRQLYRASAQQVDAAYASYDAMMTALAAEVARTYVDLRTLDYRIASMEQELDLLQGFIKLTEERNARGETLLSDVKLAELLAGTVKSELPRLHNARRQNENMLCVLLGKAPQALDDELGTTGTLPVAPLQNTVGIPADLLRRRPDVRLAEHLAAAECARVGSAKAAILPSFSIFGAIGLRSSDSENLFESDSVRSAYGGLMSFSNILLYPVTVQIVRAQDAQFQEALLNYRETVLRANMEAENTMFAYLCKQDETEQLTQNVADAREAVDLTTAAYREGKAIISEPLAALTALVSQQDQLWASRGAATGEYIALYKALGGGWETRLDKELVPAAIREQMKEEADWWTFTGNHDLTTRQVKPAPSLSAVRKGKSKTRF